MRLSVVLLVFNEELSIEDDIISISRNILDNFDDSELVIVEDYSSDNTYELCKKYESKKIRILRGKNRLGYRESLKTAIINSKYENIFFTESGTKYNFNEFMNFSTGYKNGTVFSGYRSPRYDNFSRRILTIGMNFLARGFFNFKFKDIDSGYKLLSRELYKKYYIDNWFFNDFGSAEMIIRMNEDKIKILEKKISYNQRPDESKQFSFLKIIRKSSKLILNLIKLKRHLKNL